MPAADAGSQMSKDQPGPGRANSNESNEQGAGGKPGAGAGAHAPASGGEDAQSSNTASKSYNEGCKVRVLRIGVDSLYLSYYGEMSFRVDVDLADKKLLAQSRKSKHQALAQWPVASHIFEVSDRGQRVPGQGGFAYILEDNAFRICLSSSTARSLPLAYVKISSAFLAHVGPEAAVAELNEIVCTFGQAAETPTASRVDLYADFQTNADIESFGRRAWITRAAGWDAHARHDIYTGVSIGLGGAISARLYDKTEEIKKSKKAYFLESWKRAGMDPDLPVWRLEFQAMREVLHQLGIRSFEGLMRDMGGIWGYATHTWLRLAVPQEGDCNRARWPTHPLWEQLSEIRWQLVDEPLTRKFSPERAPSQERLVRLYMGLLTSFMASQKLQGFGEGQQALLERARVFHEWRCREVLGIEFEDWLAQEIAVKVKRYNTGVNVPSEEEDSETSDEVDRDATDYYRASRGE